MSTCLATPRGGGPSGQRRRPCRTWPPSADGDCESSPPCHWPVGGDVLYPLLPTPCASPHIPEVNCVPPVRYSDAGGHTKAGRHPRGHEGLQHRVNINAVQGDRHWSSDEFLNHCQEIDWLISAGCIQSYALFINILKFIINSNYLSHPPQSSCHYLNNPLPPLPTFPPPTSTNQLETTLHSTTHSLYATHNPIIILNTPCSSIHTLYCLDVVHYPCPWAARCLTCSAGSETQRYRKLWDGVGRRPETFLISAPESSPKGYNTHDCTYKYTPLLYSYSVFV